MIEELITNQQKLPFDQQKQEELIKKYCSGVEDRIRNAHAESDAMSIVDNVCKDLEKECESDVVRSFLQRYVSDLIEKYRWKE